MRKAVFVMLLLVASPLLAQDTPKPDYWTRGVYIGIVAGQVGDIVTTRIAISKGAREANPLMKNQPVMMATKAGLAAMNIWLVHRAVTKDRERSRVKTLIIESALIGFQGWVIWHNVGVIHRQQQINR